MGAMQEIRELLSAGASSGQVIGKGYAPGTVYKVQRQLRRTAGGLGAATQAQGIGKTAGPVQPAVEGGEEHVRLRARVAELEGQVAEAEEIRKRLRARFGVDEPDNAFWHELGLAPSPTDSLVTLVEWVEQDAKRSSARAEEADAALKQGQAPHIEAERARQELQQLVRDLQAKLKTATDGQSKMAQAATWAQWQLEEERAARQEAERELQKYANALIILP